jgi:glutamate racemase
MSERAGPMVKREKIGVFDSGVGGVTVLSALRARFPSLDFAYFGDTANVPYGSKSPAQIQALSASAAERMRVHGLDALVVACNTASSWALSEFTREMGDVPVYGMVEFGVEAVMEALSGEQKRGQGKSVLPPVVVFGTKATVKSGIYRRELEASVEAQGIPSMKLEERACPLLVPLIEEGWMDHPVMDRVLEEYVAPAKALSLPEAAAIRGVALLACTHYPWIRGRFEKFLPGWIVMDSAQSLVRRFEAQAENGGTQEDRSHRVNNGTIEWFFSDTSAVPDFLFEVAERMQGGRIELRTF